MVTHFVCDVCTTTYMLPQAQPHLYLIIHTCTHTHTHTTHTCMHASTHTHTHVHSGVDDILPIMSYVIVRSGLPELVSECSIMEEFIQDG